MLRLSLYWTWTKGARQWHETNEGRWAQEQRAISRYFVHSCTEDQTSAIRTSSDLEWNASHLAYNGRLPCINCSIRHLPLSLVSFIIGKSWSGRNAIRVLANLLSDTTQLTYKGRTSSKSLVDPPFLFEAVRNSKTPSLSANPERLRSKSFAADWSIPSPASQTTEPKASR